LLTSELLTLLRLLEAHGIPAIPYKRRFSWTETTSQWRT
jgi:hypothetical protein